MDTAAGATIVLKQTYQDLPRQPACLKLVKMFAAGKEQTFVAKRIGPITLELGNEVMEVDIYIAPIVDRMLFGMDLLGHMKVKIDMEQSCMTWTDDTVPFSGQMGNPMIQQTTLCVDDPICRQRKQPLPSL